MSLTIRTLTESDIEGANRVATAAYRTPSSRRHDLQFYLRLQPDGWLFAEVDGEPAGLCGALDFGSFATIGMMGVHPSFQRQGIARRLLERILEWLDARRVPVTLLDASDMGAPLYPQYGFEDCGLTAQLRRTTPTLPETAELPSGTVSHITANILPKLAAFDAPFFGADRAVILAHYAQAHQGGAFWIGESSATPAGYIVARPENLGPWVAATPAHAETLLRAALTLPFADGPVVNVPAENRDALDLLARYGFTQLRALRHMYRGTLPLPGQRDHIYAQANFLIG